MLLRNIVAISLLTLATTAMADTIDLNLRNSSAQVQYSSPTGRAALGKTELHFGALYSDANNAHNTYVDVGMVVKDEVGSKAPGWSVGIGIKGLAAHTEGTNEQGVALGGLLRYAPPTLPRMSLVGQLYFAPNITTFGDANRYGEAVAQLEFEVIPNAAAYIGYRDIKFDLNNGSSATVDDGAYIGVRMSF
jgi:hypothetical protein